MQTQQPRQKVQAFPGLPSVKALEHFSAEVGDDSGFILLLLCCANMAEDPEEPTLVELRALMERNRASIEALRAMLERLEFTLAALAAKNNEQDQRPPGDSSSSSDDSSKLFD